MFKQTVKEGLGLKTTKGSYALEIEVEHNNLPSSKLTPKASLYWKAEADHSLKKYGLEYVMKRPKSLADSLSAIAALQTHMEECKLEVVENLRASTHVHMNVQTKTFFEVLRIVSVYYILETVLVRFCGDGREGNLFCLRNRDADMFVNWVTNSINCSDIYSFKNSDYRYSSLNLQSLFKYGSLEFRALSTKKGFTNIPDWLSILEQLKVYCLKNPDPLAEIGCISGEGIEKLLPSIFNKDTCAKLMYPGYEQDIMKDMRICQEMIYELHYWGLKNAVWVQAG